MKEEDLMIGNWVYNNYKVNKVSLLHIVNRMHLERLEPIPLTEENIVELLGFEIRDSGNYIKGNFKACFIYNRLYFKSNRNPLPKHVHKLQQLIKSLEE